MVELEGRGGKPPGLKKEPWGKQVGVLEKRKGVQPRTGGKGP